MTAYVLRRSPTQMWLVGPFDNCAAAGNWGEAASDANGEIRWQVVNLRDPEQPDRYVMPIIAPGRGAKT